MLGVAFVALLVVGCSSAHPSTQPLASISTSTTTSSSTTTSTTTSSTLPCSTCPKTHGSAWLEPSASDVLPHDAVAVRYRFRVNANQSQAWKLVFLFHLFENPADTASAFWGNQIETNFYSSRSVYTTSNTCTQFEAVQNEDLRNGEAGLFFSVPTYHPGQFPGAKPNDAMMFPKLTDEIDGLKGLWKIEHIFQQNMNGREGTIQIRRGGLITDTHGWSCLGPLPASEPYRLWTATLSLANHDYSVQFALKERLAKYWRSTQVATEAFVENPGKFGVLIGDVEVLSESTNLWSPITRWTLTTTDATPGVNTWGFRAGTLDGRAAIDVSNDGTPTYLKRGESISIG